MGSGSCKALPSEDGVPQQCSLKFPGSHGGPSQLSVPALAQVAQLTSLDSLRSSLEFPWGLENVNTLQSTDVV